MRVPLLIVFISVSILTLTGCKPPKFDQSIKCESGYSRTNVAVYSYDPKRIAVIQPDKTYEILIDETCVIVTPPRTGGTGGKKK